MITKIYNNSNILRDKAQAIVIPVNTIGIAGAGLAHQWARLYPQSAFHGTLGQQSGAHQHHQAQCHLQGGRRVSQHLAIVCRESRLGDAFS